jgi:hypothetical protein
MVRLVVRVADTMTILTRNSGDYTLVRHDDTKIKTKLLLHNWRQA